MAEHRIRKDLCRRDRELGDIGSQKFFDNFRAFKKIIAVLSLTLIMDIVAPIIRFTNRWYPMPRLAGFLHQVRLLAFIFEGWAYGLLNTKLRAAYRKTLCGDSAFRIDHPESLAYLKTRQIKVLPINDIIVSVNVSADGKRI